MDDILKALYDSFYTPPDMAELKQDVEVKRTVLRDRLAQEDRKRVLRITDDLYALANGLSMDGFLCGFKLGLALAGNLQHYRNRDGHSASSEIGQDVRPVDFKQDK